ncbi:EamA family transporter [Pleomorphomonas diazotrophica]|uniref:EamA family transporter n=1 Tax=Pleomorphomonas diazotrophica TaxID=1166257 RepID=A0A1I4RSM4_9HYPH|nr:EamA family transporter [Pleomorphomonas diazotrophica]PKR88081.1 EamA family transporter [Pleomorphomonas diazotrophica]SFM55216.1 EamA domain-containing membrane protein RarD [Pleomorphomonas diazotrophica]
MPSRTRATLIGLTAILMWSMLGVFTGGSGAVPPFLLNALCFGLSGSLATIWLIARGRAGVLRQPFKVWVVGTLGLFGYHALYFTALRTAPLVEAGLINYLWPLLIVLFSGFLPGERLRPHHLAGVILGFSGAALLVTAGRSLTLDGGYAFGYLAAFLAAVVWAGYSVVSRRFGGVPSEAVAGFCLATALLSLVCHLAFEQTVLPAAPLEWLMVLLLGAFPVGLAFFVWDHGVKHGDIQLIGTAAYATPVLSTLLLTLTGYGTLGWTTVVACALVTLGAVVVAWDALPFRRRAAASKALT